MNLFCFARKKLTECFLLLPLQSQASETEYDRINSDVGNSDTTSDTEDSENGEVDLCNDELNHVEDPFVLWFRQSQPKQTLAKPSTKDTSKIFLGSNFKSFISFIFQNCPDILTCF